MLLLLSSSPFEHVVGNADALITATTPKWQPARIKISFSLSTHSCRLSVCQLKVQRRRLLDSSFRPYQKLCSTVSAQKNVIT